MSPAAWLIGLFLVATAGCCCGGRHTRQDAPWIHLVPPADQPSTPPNESAPKACPANPEDLPVFLRIGHMGGDCRMHCENTLDAARAGLAKGLNALELDVCMSGDGVPFLWHDCDPSEFSARMRQFGKYVVNEHCLPYRNSSVYGRAPSNLSFAQIRENFGYKRTWYKNDRIDRYVVPSLREFLAEVGRNPSVIRLYLDMKIPAGSSLQQLVNSSLAIAKELGVEHKLLFSFPSVEQVQSAQSRLPVFTQPGGTQARLLLGLGVDPEDIIVSNSYRPNLASAEKILSGLSRRNSLGYFDRHIVQYHIAMISLKIHANAALSSLSIYSRLKVKLAPVRKAQRLCIPYVSLRYFSQVPSLLGDPFYKKIISRALAERQRSGYPVKIISSNINDRRMALWLRRQGVDGIMTDCPTMLW